MQRSREEENQKLETYFSSVQEFKPAAFSKRHHAQSISEDSSREIAESTNELENGKHCCSDFFCFHIFSLMPVPNTSELVSVRIISGIQK